MFESSVVRARAMQSGHRYRLLTLSLAMHTCAIAAIVAATLISVRLPEDAPKQMSIPILLRPVTIPPALGTPHPKPAAAKPAPAAAAPAVPRAPVVIPDQIIPTTAASSVLGTDTTGTGTDATGPAGSPDGVEGGITTETNVPQPAAPAAPIRVTAGMKAPVVLQRVLPEYPRVAMLGHMNGWVIVECVIDKSGHVRDAKVLRSSFPAFEQPAIDAVQRWVFSPGLLQGQPVDVIFDLTVNFQINR